MNKTPQILMACIVSLSVMSFGCSAPAYYVSPDGSVRLGSTLDNGTGIRVPDFRPEVIKPDDMSLEDAVRYIKIDRAREKMELEEMMLARENDRENRGGGGH